MINTFLLFINPSSQVPQTAKTFTGKFHDKKTGRGASYRDHSESIETLRKGPVVDSDPFPPSSRSLTLARDVRVIGPLQVWWA